MGTEEKNPLVDKLTPDEIWRIYLSEGSDGMRKYMTSREKFFMDGTQFVFKHTPSDPRCVLCYSPFHGFGAPLMRAIGRGQSTLNPSVCADCENMVRHTAAGAEVEMTMLFADIRGSTGIAERIGTTAFSQLIRRFYKETTDELIRHLGMIDKLIGDEVTAWFVPGIAGQDYTQKAIKAAWGILNATGHNDPEGPWAPVGVGVHSGMTFVGAVGGSDGLSDITVLGDVANTAARLASEAKAGEVLISEVSAQRAGLETRNLNHKMLQLKGKSETLQTWSLPGSASKPNFKDESSGSLV
jgi:adenylate cyclase